MSSFSLFLGLFFLLFISLFFFLCFEGEREVSRGEIKKKKKKTHSFFHFLKKNSTNSGARVRDSVLLQRVRLAEHSCVSDSIVGWGSSVGKWARVANKAVIGEDCHVKDEVVLNGTVVLPHKELKESQMEAGAIVM